MTGAPETTLTTRSALLAGAASLRAALSRREGPVAVLLDAGADYLRAVLAAMAAGRPFCTCHTDWAVPELAAALEDAGVTTLVSSRRCRGGHPLAPSIEVIDIEAIPVDAAGREGDPAASEELQLDPGSRFYVGFTSGSSGRPKPFTRRWRSWQESFAAAGELYGIEPGVTVLLPGSIQHSHFLFGAMLAFERGASVRLYERFDAERLLGDLASDGTSVVYLVPTMLSALATLADAAPATAVRTLVVSGAKLEPHHWRAAERCFPNATVRELYGASETSFITTGTGRPDHDDPGYVGVPFPGVEIELRPLADAATPLAPGSGVVWVRSPYLFDGYLRRDAGLDGGAGEDGFLTVGDIGRFRPDGGLSLIGRSSNLLITGGKNVHPEEIERVLVDHPDVADCAVTGVPDDYWGERLVAIVALADDAERLDERGLADYLRVRVAAHKVPKQWVTVERLPQTKSGKLARAELPALVTAAPVAPAAAPSTAAVPISLSGVTLRLGGRDILGGIDLELCERRVALIGRNGSGKSSLLRLIGGLETASDGTLSVDGLDPTRRARELRGCVGYVFQNPETQLVLPTVAEDLVLGLPKAERKDGRAIERAREVLRRLGIAALEERYCHELSGGEQQLVALAGALVREPRVMLFDEPTTFLDLHYVERLRAIMADLSQTLLVATHDLELAADCERVLVVDDGAIAFDGAPHEAIARYRELARWS